MQKDFSIKKGRSLPLYKKGSSTIECVILSAFALCLYSPKACALPSFERATYTKHEKGSSAAKTAKEAAKKTYSYMKHSTKEALGIEVDEKTLREAYDSLDLRGMPVSSKDGYQVGFIEDFLIGKKGEGILIISRSFPLDLDEPRHILFIEDGTFSGSDRFNLKLSKEEFKDRPTVKIKP